MSSMLRKQKRQAAKAAYKKFKKTFSGTRKMQLEMTAAERRRATQDGQPILGKCPTFKQWYDAVRTPAQFQAEPEEVQEHIESLEWDDD